METNPKPQIVSTTGNAIKEEALRKFETSLLGEVSHPREERYERSRLLWNGMTDPRRPGMIVRCATTVDVIRSVEFARTILWVRLRRQIARTRPDFAQFSEFSDNRETGLWRGLDSNFRYRFSKLVDDSF